MTVRTNYHTHNDVIKEQTVFIRGLSIDWNEVGPDSYLRGIEAINELDYLPFRQPITFFVGENGSGKSTLLEAIAIAYGFNPEGGTKNYHFSTRDTHSELCDAIRLVRNPSKARWGYFLRAESFYNVATAEEEYAEVKPQLKADIDCGMMMAREGGMQHAGREPEAEDIRQRVL